MLRLVDLFAIMEVQYLFCLLFPIRRVEHDITE